MAVVFTSTIRVDEAGEWYIELLDITDEESAAKEPLICADMDEYEEKIEALGSEYGGHIDEVRWQKADDVPPFVLDQIRVIMAERREKLEEEMGEPITPVTDKL